MSLSSHYLPHKKDCITETTKTGSSRFYSLNRNRKMNHILSIESTNWIDIQLVKNMRDEMIFTTLEYEWFLCQPKTWATKRWRWWKIKSVFTKDRRGRMRWENMRNQWLLYTNSFSPLLTEYKRPFITLEFIEAQYKKLEFLLCGESFSF